MYKKAISVQYVHLSNIECILLFYYGSYPEPCSNYENKAGTTGKITAAYVNVMPNNPKMRNLTFQHHHCSFWIR